jgi:hypothetical protein
MFLFFLNIEFQYFKQDHYKTKDKLHFSLNDYKPVKVRFVEITLNNHKLPYQVLNLYFWHLTKGG